MAEAVAMYEAEFGEITEAEMAAQHEADRAIAIRVRDDKIYYPDGTVEDVLGKPPGGVLTLILDAGALLALEKNDKAVWERFRSATLAGFPPVTHGGVVGQAWRAGGPRQAPLAAALAGTEILPLDEELGLKVGRLLGRSGARDVIDAALVLLAEDGDEIITSDPSDLAVLSAYTGIGVEVISV
jgi:hypothetical protein